MKIWLSLIGLALASKGLPTAAEADYNIDPTSYITAVSKIANVSTVRKIFSQFESFPPKKLNTPTNFKPPPISLFRKALEYSYLPTCPEEKVLGLKCICDKDLTDIGFARNLEYRANSLIAYNKKTRKIIVVYRYTSSVRNWLTNFDFTLAPLEGAPKDVQVHRGMLEYYLTIHNQTMAKAAAILKNRDVRGVLVTGYSLGASIAVLSTPFWAKFKEEHSKPVSVIAYSPARIGPLTTKLYIESLGINIVHYTNRNDIVPQLPPRSLNYTHIGLEIHERASTPITSELVICSQEYDEDPTCAWGEPGWRSAVAHLAPFNHPFIIPPYCGESDQRSNLPNYA